MSFSDSTVSAYTGPRPDVHALFPPGARRVLDVGCSDGTLGSSLGADEVWGIEFDPAFAARAAGRLYRVMQGDAVEQMRELESGSFNVVICADVLEHLTNPEAAMAEAARVLRPGGAVVVSLPNVRFYTTFVQLGLRARWPREDRGVHDRTHLSWFTDRDARAMLEGAGFTVEACSQNVRLADSHGHPRNRYASYVARGPLRDFCTYQHLYRAVLPKN